jgi:hypothetical protein
MLELQKIPSLQIKFVNYTKRSFITFAPERHTVKHKKEFFNNNGPIETNVTLKKFIKIFVFFSGINNDHLHWIPGSGFLLICDLPGASPYQTFFFLTDAAAKKLERLILKSFCVRKEHHILLQLKRRLLWLTNGTKKLECYITLRLERLAIDKHSFVSY